MAARKKGASSAPKASDEKKTPTQIVGQINQKKLRSLMADCRSAYKDSREINGEIGAKIKDAVENENLHKKAFATIRSLDRMEPEKLADFLDTFEYYLDISGLKDRAAKVMKMDFDDDGQGEGAPKSGSVTPFPTPKGEAAE